MADFDFDENVKRQLEFSLQISKALGGISRGMAPFYIQVLRGYAKLIADNFPGSENMANIMSLFTDEHMIVEKVKKESPAAGTTEDSM